MTTLPDDLAALLATHGIAATTDSLLATMTDGMGLFVDMEGPSTHRPVDEYWQAALWVIDPEFFTWTKAADEYGPTPFIALARAYQAMIESKR